MNAENFINYAILAIVVFAACGYLLWDAWLDHQANRREADSTCCPAGFGCDKCYYRIGE